MAKMNVFTYDNLVLYDELLKGYVDAADAKSLKHVTIEGNVLKFYKVDPLADDSVAAYEITLPETDLTAITERLTALENGKADKATTLAGYGITDAYTKTEVDGIVDGLEEDIQGNTDAIAAINNEESGILAQAKAYADAEVKELADGAVKTNTDAIAVLNGDESTEGSVKKAVKDSADAINATIGTVAEGKTVVGMIEDVIANGYDDEEVRGLISDNADAIAALSTKVDDNETDIEAKMTALTGRVEANETAIADRYTKGETDTKIAEAVAASKHLKKEIVESLPAVEDAAEDIIYMVAVEGGEGVQKYEEYMLINGALEKIGDTATDLTGYAKETYVDEAIAALDADVTSAAVEEGKGIQVQVVEVDGKVTTVAVTGNYDNSYDAKGAADTALESAKTYADGKDAAIAEAKQAGTDAATAVTTLENGQVATNKSNIEALQTLVGEGYESIPEADIRALFA